MRPLTRRCGPDHRSESRRAVDTTQSANRPTDTSGHVPLGWCARRRRRRPASFNGPSNATARTPSLHGPRQAPPQDRSDCRSLLVDDTTRRGIRGGHRARSRRRQETHRLDRRRRGSRLDDHTRRKNDPAQSRSAPNADVPAIVQNHRELRQIATPPARKPSEGLHDRGSVEHLVECLIHRRHCPHDRSLHVLSVTQTARLGGKYCGEGVAAACCCGGR
jgi:hypothetical protein